MSLTRRPRHKQEVPVPKSGKGCWTCKARKIGCDQKLPLCNNCIRTGRSCEGYGIKLHWPESADGRRPQYYWDSKTLNTAEYIIVAKSGTIHFLNTTYDDCSPAIARSLNVGFETAQIVPEDKRLLTYYHEVLSRMITTIDDSRNGFRTVLIPNALSGKSLASQSLREAILALSAFHLQGYDAAVKYKVIVRFN
ncbi:Arginine-requiring 81 [Hyphodiscus hymeniophilus]|uniref:Arginine-requiring 81 n=1 Tax=Hyphodiscus hymeniophilus TaxID=353542 RepID=A0A9P6SK24_9HELO|nr:Arginine-requiring 81 [Hyphodiscus hymeniophilus]